MKLSPAGAAGQNLDLRQVHQRLFEALGLLLTNGHLPVELQHRHPAPLGHEGDLDAVHLGVMLAARLVVLVQGR
jgi:hypothetical protein